MAKSHELKIEKNYLIIKNDNYEKRIGESVK